MKKSAAIVVAAILLVVTAMVPCAFTEGVAPAGGAAATGATGFSGISPGIAPTGSGSFGFSASPAGVSAAPGLPSSGHQSGTALPLALPGQTVPGTAVTSPMTLQQPQQVLLGQQVPGQQIPQAEQGKAEQQKPESVKNESGKEKGLLPGEAKIGASAELSEVERVMSDETPSDLNRAQSFAVKGVTQFGYTYFRGGAEGFAPLSDVPVGPDYVVGTGDRIVLTTWGSLEGTYELDVNRNGEIALPKIGTVKVQGVAFGQLPGLLKTSLGRIFKDFQLSVSLGRVRLMKVYLVGDVAAPGDYTISSFSTVINALSAAGGPTKNGTLRNIQIKRGGKLAETIDLYDFFIKGDKSRDIRLQPGDTVFVPHIGRVAGIAGNVRRPAIYELKDEKSLKDLIDLANGIKPTGYLQRLQVNRVDAYNKRVVTDYNIDPKSPGDSLEKLAGGMTIQDLDFVKVFHIDNTLRGYVRLNGYVLRPGEYALRPGMKVAELLTADNILPEYAEGTAELVRLVPPDQHPEVSYFSPAKALAGDPSQNIELKEFDQIRLFSRWDLEEMPRVRVIGEVQKPGDYRLLRNMTVRELVLQAGNPRLTAYLPQADIVRVKREGDAVSSYAIPINLGEALKGSPRHNIVLEPLDELIVRRIPNWLEETERYSTIRGEVRFPGTYPIFKGERLSAAIQRAGGYTDKAYLFGAKFTRSSVQKLQQERMEEAIARMDRDIAIKQQSMAVTAGKEDVTSTQLALDGLKKSIEKLRLTRAEGRIAIRLESLERLKNSTYDLELMGGDALEIPQSPMAVTVFGEVANPTTVVWVPQRDVSFYLAMAGGPTGNAENDEMYVVMANGMVKGKASDGLFGGFMSTTLHPGDAVIVPQKMERISWMKELKDISQILANIAVTAGVPLAIIKK